MPYVTLYACHMCRILPGGFSGVSRVSSVRVRFRVKVTVRDRCRGGSDALFPNYFGEDLLYSTITGLLQGKCMKLS